MGIRGKQSTKGLPVNVVPTLARRMDAPPELTPVQAEIWRAVLASRPIDWFDAGSAPLLAAFCRATETQSKLAKEIDGFASERLVTKDGAIAFARLLALQETQARLAIRLATSMRLSQHARRSGDAGATAARNGQTAKRLWEG